MPRVDIDDFLTDYERAVCYFTLPKLVYHISPIGLFVYSIFVIITFSVTFWALAFGNQILLYIGTISLIVIALFGFVLFTGRALLSELRWRRCLAEAHGTKKEETLDLPDPFEQHELYLIPQKEKEGTLFPCSNRDGEVIYFIENRGDGWIVKDVLENEVCKITARRSWLSISFTYRKPVILDIYRGEKKIARLKPRFSFYGSAYLITIFDPQPDTYWIIQSGIFHQGELVGRIYQLRKIQYLDIQKQHFNPGILAFLITL